MTFHTSGQIPSTGDGSRAHILQICALFEQDFNIDWLAGLTGLKATRLLTEFETHVASGRLESGPPGVYRFRDPGFKEQTIKEIAPEQREAIHQRIAAMLLAEADEASAKSLSHHLLEITNSLDGCHSLIKAGDLHLKRYDNEAAFQCYAKAIKDLSLLDGEAVDRLFAGAAVKYSNLSTARHDTDLVLNILYDAMDRATRQGDKETSALLLLHSAKNEWLKARYSKALKNFDLGWRRAKAVNTPRVLRTAQNFSTFFLYWQGRFKEVVDNYEKTQPNVDKLPLGQFPLLAATTVGYCYTQVGQITQGLGMLDTVGNFCAQRGDTYLSSYAIGNMGAVMLTIRRLDEALAYLTRSCREAGEAGNQWVRLNTLITKSYTHYLMGDTSSCIRDLKLFLTQSRQVQAFAFPYPYILAIALAMKKGKLPDVKGVSLEDEIHKKLNSKTFYSKALAYRYQSYNLQIENQPVDSAVDSLKSAMKWAAKSGHAIEMAKIKLELARLYIYRGSKEKAGDLADEGASVLARFNEDLIPNDLKGLINTSPKPNDIYNTILQLTQEMAAIRDYKDLLQHIISSINRVTGAERGAIFLVDPDAAGLVIRGSRNLTSAQIEEPGFSASMNLINEVAKTGKGRIMEKPSSQGTFPADSIRSRICVPMLLRNRVTGVLYHDNRLLSSAFKAPHLDLLSFFGAIAAIAIDNALAGNEIRRLNKKLNREKEYYQEEHIQSENFKEIIGKSRGIKKVLSQIEQVAGSNATVLITGETGVGKELVARAVHRLSPRKTNPFIRVHCSALPENLIPSELFGHEKGAFTGAAKRRTGRFELADSGSLFMDELGEINPDIQTRLLRVLQTREFERVGGTQTLKSDFRLIAATNKDLGQEVKAGRFRSDLFYRINVFPIHIPPLRERRKDIPLLAGHFLRIHSQRTGKEFIGIDKQDLAALMNYDWPGNIRELENVIERGCILSRGRHPRIPKLTPDIGLSQLAPQGGVTLRETEERHLRWALENTGWKVRGPGGAAQLLDINPSTLRFRMKKHDIRRPGS